MMVDSHERLSGILRQIESEHQEVKRAYFRRFGRAGLGSRNNRMTLDWFDSEMAAGSLKALTEPLDELKLVFRSIADRREKYWILREIYAINPSFHESWFYTNHLRSDFKSLCTNRHGLKAYLTSARRGTLDRCRQGICTTVVRYTILLENLVSPLLSESLMDTMVEPSKDILADVKSAVASIRDAEGTPRQVADTLPLVFRITRGLLEATHYHQIESTTLLDRWLLYAPCGINEGPIFTRHSDTDLPGVLKSVPVLEETVIRGCLRNHFVFEDVTH